MKIHIVSAFPERREHALAQLAKAGPHLEPSIVEAPLGRQAAAEGWRASPAWREPRDNPRPHDLLTWGQVACRAGHARAWERVALDNEVGAFVVEDDLRVLRPFPISSELPRVLEWPHDAFYYLGGCPLASEDKLLMDGKRETGKAVKGEAWMRAYDTYWCVGYYLSKELAARLCELNATKANIIPTDELLPHCYGTSLRAAGALGGYDVLFKAYLPAKGWYVEPARLPAWHSGTEHSEHAFALRVILHATEPSKAERALNAYGELGYHAELVGQGESNWDTNIPGGIDKLKRYYRKICELILDGDLHREDLVLLSDSYDTLPLAPPEQLIRDWAFLTRKSAAKLPVVVGGERNCWPNNLESLQARYQEGPYRFPNSGLIMGHVYRVAELIERACTCYLGNDDQAAIQRAGLLPAWDSENLIVDSNARLFGNLARERDKYELKNGYPFNTLTQLWPRILHANGPNKNLDWLEKAKAHSALPATIKHSHSRHLSPSDNNILLVPIFEPTQARRIADIAIELPGWKALEGDAYPHDELRVHKADVDLYAFLEREVLPKLDAAYKSNFLIGSIGKIKDAFFSRSEPGLDTLKMHCDISHASISIPLRKAEVGGELLWIRQELSDKDVEIGTAIIWPGAVSHPHKVSPLFKGKRVSLVIWTEL